MKEQLPVSPPNVPGVASSTPPDTSNGRSDRYQQSLSKNLPPRKQDIEAQLKSRSESIASSLEAIQSEFNATSGAVKRIVESPVTRVLLAFGAGLVVGRMFRSSDDGGKQANDLAAILTEQVEAALAAGEPPDDAVRRVLDASGLPANGEKHTGGALKWIAGLALRTLVSQGLRGASSFFGGTHSENASLDFDPDG